MDRGWFIALNEIPARVPGIAGPVVAVASYGLLLYGALLLCLWAPARTVPDARRHLVLLAVLAAALSLAANAAINAVYPRPRPFLVLPAHVLTPSPPHDPSFPSDHAAVAASIAVTLLLGGEMGWGAAALAGAALIGLARVMMGVHYPTDIFGGMAVGAVCGAVVVRVRARVRPVLDYVLTVARRVRLA
jgi:membrane-associated phospholipid phosphatase